MNKDLIKKVFFNASLLIVSAIILYPIFLMIKISLSQPGDIFEKFTQKNLIWPKLGLTIEHWKNVYNSGLLFPSLIKSLKTATVVTFIAVLVAAPASYVISRIGNKKIKYLFIISLFISRVFPEVAIALPISVRFLSWNLIDTTLGLVLAHLIKVLPYVAWILVGTFEAIPKSLEEASFVDGAGRVKTLFNIIFPLSLPGISVAAMLVWLESWNEFTYALYLTVSENTLPLQTYYYINRGGIFNSAAYATIITVPVIILTFILQRYIKSGMLSGGVK
ncbi:MAG: carbohydrate ABC transporter permease [Candidatus Muiribacterium halophilum]|uniref:Carbohydrate ABC transporter permease n=1 Tax=Muiribacterium halophilum TaxID=2053465 RepID=A0A2N5ZGK0_MUIH1|nr:MAG: carbohydrate ABC transporter permease [Candidatus Muirbacterium halophilum]